MLRLDMNRQVGELIELIAQTRSARAGLAGPMPAVPVAQKAANNSTLRDLTDREPATRMDARTQQLADAIAAAQTTTGNNSAVSREKPELSSAARLQVRDEAARTAEVMTKQLAWMEEAVRRFDNTGEIWIADNNGQLVRAEGRYAGAAPKDPQAYFDGLRRGLDGYRQGIEQQRRTASSW